MSVYLQVEVIPIFAAGVICFNMSSGLCIFDEIRFYNALHLCLLFFGAGLCIAGVIIFATKHSSKKKII